MTAKKVCSGKAEKTARRIVYLTFEALPGKQVFVAGSFNDWKPEKQLLDKENTGVYRCQLRLEPGEYQYKLVVDGNWCLDAANPNFTPNGYGSLNNVLVVKKK